MVAHRPSQMNTRKHRWRSRSLDAVILILGLSLVFVPSMSADSPPAGRITAGKSLESLTVGKTVYREVVIKSVTARTVMFKHRGGLASVKLRELAPEWQERFGYDPAAEQASDEALKRAQAERQARLAAAAQADQAAQAKAAASRFERVLQACGQPVTPLAEVDLRPRFRELELHAKNQGRRPSCAIFAVVSAIEYIHAENTGKAEKFSEEYLIWATRKSLQRPVQAEAAMTGEDADAGFALTEVVMALRSYGIPPERAMPNTMGRAIDAVAEPAPEVIAAARSRTQGSVYQVPGRDNATVLNNVVHALNAGLPVAIGTAWPRFFNMRAALLNSQEPSYSHAVTLVGYRCPTGRIEDATFIFKNSWGADWGANGYGYATYSYLLKHLHTAILLELRTN